MTDDQNILADMANNLFGSLGSDVTLGEHWSAIEEVTLTSLLLPEEQDGFGGTWDDALLVFRLAGYHALALPVPEACIAAALTGRRDGRGTIASGSQGSMDRGSFTGTITGICYAEGADYVVAPSGDGSSMVLEGSELKFSFASNIAGEARAKAVANAAKAYTVDTDVFALGALARVAQIAGAMDAALAKSVDYANERQQFGRPLSKFQAVQQSLASFATEAAAANCASMGAAQAMARGHAPFEIAAAKLRANRVVGIGTALAHQVHGGIGFTQEYPLHPLTRRLWAWRSEFGNDIHWSKKLGAKIVARGPENFWADLTALTD